jgi:hypothetical protein
VCILLGVGVAAACVLAGALTEEACCPWVAASYWHAPDGRGVGPLVVLRGALTEEAG